MRVIIEWAGVYELRMTRTERPVRHLCRAFAKAVKQDGFRLVARNEVLDEDASVGAVLSDGDHAVALQRLSLPAEGFEVTVVRFDSEVAAGFEVAPECAAWRVSRSLVERSAANAVTSEGPHCVALHPRSPGVYTVRSGGDEVRTVVAAPVLKAVAWDELSAARRDRILGWLRAHATTLGARIDRADAAQLPLPPEREEACDAGAPMRWRRPKNGRVSVLRDFLTPALASRIVRWASRRMVSRSEEDDDGLLMGDDPGRRGAAAPKDYRSNRVALLSDGCGAGGILADLRTTVSAYFPEVDSRDVEYQCVHYAVGQEYRLHHDVRRRDADGVFPRCFHFFGTHTGPKIHPGT